jgi:hypothetical protein
VNQQVRQLLGEGLDLRFCVVRPPEFVGHAVEEAQHLPISLVRGLENRENRPPVDILVPNGEIVEQELTVPGNGFEAVLHILPASVPGTTTGFVRAISRSEITRMSLRGAARSDRVPAGGGTVHFAGATEIAQPPQVASLASAVASVQADGQHMAAFRALVPEQSDTPPAAAERAFIQPGISARMHTLAAAASLHTAAARPPGGIFAPPGQEAPVFNPLNESNLAAFWATMRCDRNAFELAASEITPVELRTTLSMPGPERTAVDVQFNGTL